MEDEDRAAQGRLAGARVGILEARMTSQLADLVVRHGGAPRIAPALVEEPIEDPAGVTELVRAIVEGEVQFVFFLTGVGAAAFFRQAERLGQLPRVVEALQSTTNVCRGQKPWRALRERGVPISVTVREPYTTAEVLETMEELPLDGAGVALLHFGERSETLAEAAGSRAGELFELQLYAWRLPADVEPLREMVDEVIAGELDAVLFTTQVQVRHLLAVAKERGRREELVRALNGQVAVAAVGPTSAGALEAEGIQVDVVPKNPKMGPMILALGEHLTASRAALRPTDPA
jgi:uroporphyrinogen-III synthase